MQALYQKYRPIRFSEVVGQEAIKSILSNEIAGGMVVHAYLFSGPRAVGKTTTARILARAVNCERRKEGECEPCNECVPCESILSGRTLDVMEIDAASNTGVDNVRDVIITASRMSNTQLKCKVFILDEVHMLSTAAFNALLKTLEEPPSNVIFILATTELHKVPATIVSRCQRLDFKKIAPDLMLARLKYIVKEEKKKLDDEVLAEVVRRSGGCERDAESLLGQILALGDGTIDTALAMGALPRSDHELVRNIAHALIGKQCAKGLAIVGQLVDEAVDLSVFTVDLIDFLRNIVLIRVGAGDALQVLASEKKEMAELAEKTSKEQLVVMMEFFMRAHADVRWFSTPQVPLEIAVIKSCAE